MSLSLSDIIPPLDYYTPRLIFLKSNMESGACGGEKREFKVLHLSESENLLPEL